MHDKVITYSFLNFQFTPSQHLFLHHNQTIKLSKKNYLLLLALLQANGDVLAKDDLIAQVWPGQIVTDAALNKQITRLRQTLAACDDTPLIETVRGVGIRFTTDVQVIDNPRQHKSGFKQVAIITALLALVSLLWWSLQQQSSTDWQPPETINMALLPGFSDDDWLSVGALDYLSNQLQAVPAIQTIKPEADWFGYPDAEVLAVELSQTAGIEYVLTLENQQQAGSYSADLSLRNAEAVVAKASLQANSVNQLLQQVEAWTLAKLEIENQRSENSGQHDTTEFAMENYLRGVAAAQARQYSEAQRLLKTATNEDPEFYLAWFALVEVESELGHFDKALGLIETVADTLSSQSDLMAQAESIKAKVLVYLNRLEEAQQLLDQSTATAQNKQNIAVIMNNLGTQALLHDYLGTLGEPNLANHLRLLELTKKYRPTPNQIAQVEHNLAVIHLNLGNISEASLMIDAAIERFKQTQNAEGLVSAYRVQGNLLSLQAKNGEALLAMEQAMPWLDQVSGARSLANFWTAKARSHLAVGQLHDARACIDALHQMSVTYATLQPRVKAWIIEAELAITYQQLAAAKTVIEQLMSTIIADPEAYPMDAPYAVALELYTLAISGEVTEARNKKQQYLSAYPILAEAIPLELQRIEAQLLAAEGYQQQAIEKLQQLEQAYLANQDILTANYIANQMIKIAGYENIEAVEVIINRVKNRPHFVYPINKHRAIITHAKGQLIPAITLLTELKVQAKDFWQPADQLLLESWQSINKEPNN